MEEKAVYLYELKKNELKKYEPMQLLVYDSLIGRYCVEDSTQIKNGFRTKYCNDKRYYFFAFTEPKLKINEE